MCARTNCGFMCVRTKPAVAFMCAQVACMCVAVICTCVAVACMCVAV